MSNIYITEPITKGKVVMSTTFGDLDIELWSKEAPRACRNFVQLCLEGYYDGTVFHRIIKEFMVQGGDPTGTGEGGESIFGQPFDDEIHSRLRFTHRGIVAMASSGPGTNGSQFFMTFDRCDWLNGKHTIFGKVTGDTIFNLVRFGEVETDDNDRPLELPVITKTEVLWNPFEDIVPRELPRRLLEVQAADDGITQIKGSKNKSLLSFADDKEEEEGEEEIAVIPRKIRSSHDVLDDPRLSKEAAVEEAILKKAMEDFKNKTAEAKEAKEAEETKEAKEAKESKEMKKDVQRINAVESIRRVIASRTNDGDSEMGKELEDPSTFDAAMRDKVKEQRAALASEKKQDQDSDLLDEAAEARRVEASRLKKDILSFKKEGAEERKRQAEQHVLQQSLSPLQAMRQQYMTKRKKVANREQATLDKLASFHKSLQVKESEGTEETKEDNEEDGDTWMIHALKFVRTPWGDRADRANDDYAVFDPRFERREEERPISYHQQRLQRKKTPPRW